MCAKLDYSDFCDVFKKGFQVTYKLARSSFKGVGVVIITQRTVTIEIFFSSRLVFIFSIIVILL